MPTPEEARDWLAHALANDELAHHGVMGQKWGVRHDHPSSGRTRSTASTASPRAKAAVKAVSHKPASSVPKAPVKVSTKKDTKLGAGDVILLGVGGVVGVAYAADGVRAGVATIGGHAKLDGVLKDVKNIQENTKGVDSAKDFLRDKMDTSVPASTTFHRVASRVETEVDAPKYATYLQDDVLHYRKTWVTPGRTAYQAHYITKMTATKPVTIASPESMVKTFEKELHSKLSDGETLFQKIDRATAGDLSRYRAPAAGGKLSDSAIVDYIVGHNRSNIWGDDVGKASSEIMQKAGYAAVTDINNTGSMSRKHAVIILEKAAFNVTSSKLSLAERGAAGLAQKKIAKAALTTVVKTI